MSVAGTELALDTFKELVWDAVVKAVLQKLFVAVPLLGWGPIGYVISHFAVKYSDEIYAAVKMFIVVEAITLRNKSFEQAYNKASVKLHIVAKTDGIDSVSFKEARDADKKALSKFVNFDSVRAS